MCIKIESILQHYGPEHQTRKCLSEMSELAVELHHALEGRGDNEKIREELGDVKLMVAQMELVYGNVDDVVEAKVKRTIERMEG